MAVNITMAVIVTAIIDFTIPLCSSLTGGIEGSVKILCSGVVWGWDAAPVL